MQFMSSGESVSVRPATTDDREQVIAINEDVYGGQDYLPALYNTWMDSQKHYSLLAQINEKVVAFETSIINVLTSDGVVEVLASANRVRDETQGRGILRGLKDTMTSQLAALHGKHRTLAVARTTDYWAGAVDERKWTKIQTWGLYSCRTGFTPTEVETFVKTPPELVAGLRTRDVMTKLSRDNTRMVHENAADFARLLASYGPYMIYDVPFQAQQVTEQYMETVLPTLDGFASFDSSDKNNIESYSVRSIYRSTVGVNCHMFYYGNSTGGLLQHLHSHLEECIRPGGPCHDAEHLYVVLHFPSKIGIKCVIDAMEMSFGQQLDKTAMSELWLVEKCA